MKQTKANDRQGATEHMNETYMTYGERVAQVSNAVWRLQALKLHGFAVKLKGDSFSFI